MASTAPAHPRWRRLGWFILLWLGGVAAVAGVAYLLRTVMKLTLT